MGYMAKLFQDNAGNPSSMRLIAVAVPVVIVGVWAWTCLSTGTLISFDWADVGAIGALGSAKAYQKGKEV